MRSRRPRVRRIARPGAPCSRTGRAAAALALAGALLACGGAEPRNVVLVVVDTLRVDRLGTYGHERPTSPHLDRLAQEGIVFERAYAPASWTMPSVASILTGLPASEHGVSDPHAVLRPEIRTLPEVLREHGWATGGVVSHYLLNRERGFAQGYEHYSTDHARGHDYVSTPGVTFQAIRMLDRFAEQERPFFLFVHYFDPHYRYRPHEEVDFAPRAAGVLDGSQTIHELRALADALRPEEIAYLRAVYDEEIFVTDRGFGRLLDRLRSLGLREETVVVFTADHGEELMDRGWIGHTPSLHEEVIRVPLVLRVPGEAGPGGPVDEPVSLTALAPTLLELLGVEPGSAALEPPSLLPRIRGEEDAPAAPVLSAVDFVPRPIESAEKRAHKRALVDGRFKLIRDLETGALALYDLAADPEERDDLAEERPETRRRLRAALRERVESANVSRVRRKALDEEERARLRALGYLE